jgi:hypothetical protein
MREFHRLWRHDDVLMRRLRTLLGRRTLGGNGRVIARAEEIARTLRYLYDVWGQLARFESGK